MILVTGATGTTGSEVVKQLVAVGAKVRAMVHTPAKTRNLKALGVEISVGDYDKPADLDAALAGVEKAYLVTPSGPRQAHQEGQFIDAAKRNGVKHVVRLSVIGVNPESSVPIMRWHAEAETRLRGSGLGWTMLRPNGFMTNMLMNAATIKAEGRFYSPLGDARVSYVDVRDIAAVAVQALTRNGHENKAYELTGPQALTNAELATAMSSSLGRSVEAVKTSTAEARKAMLGMGMPEWYADSMLKLNEFFVAGRGAVVSKDVEKVTGKPARAFEQWVNDHADRFR